MIHLFKSNFDVEYVTHSGDDNLIIKAMLVDKDHEWDEYPDTKRIKALIRDGHTSPFEHCSITLRFAVPIFVARQLMRHRTASYNEFSGRYRVMLPIFYIPEGFHGRKPGSKKMDMIMEPLQDDELALRLSRISFHESYESYNALIASGVAEEQARIVLPVATYTEYFATNDLHNWMKFLALRMDSHAQKEARIVAEQVYAILKELYPAAIAAWDEAGRPNF